MTTVRIAELKDRLSEHLRAVEAGGEVVVLDRDRPIARIVSIAAPERRVHLRRPTRQFAEIRDRRRAPARWGISSTDLLLEERGDR